MPVERVRLNIVPGVGIGPINIGMTFEEVVNVLGQPSYNREVYDFVEGPDGLPQFPLEEVLVEGSYDIGFRDIGLHVSISQNVISAVDVRGDFDAYYKGVNVMNRLHFEVLDELQAAGHHEIIPAERGLRDTTGSLYFWCEWMFTREEYYDADRERFEDEPEAVILQAVVAPAGYYDQEIWNF